MINSLLFYYRDVLLSFYLFAFLSSCYVLFLFDHFPLLILLIRLYSYLVFSCRFDEIILSFICMFQTIKVLQSITRRVSIFTKTLKMDNLNIYLEYKTRN